MAFSLFSITKPSQQRLLDKIDQQSQLPFNYPEVGATTGRFPDGYDHHRHVVPLGRGRRVFEQAKSAFQSWRPFDVGWAEAVPRETSIAVGSTIAIRARFFGVWAVAFDRIVYVIDDADADRRRYGFAVGTLGEHPEQGEEKFVIEMNRADQVTYEVAAFYRPHTFPARVFWPYLRRRFDQFRVQSADSMREAVRPAEEPF